MTRTPFVKLNQYVHLNNNEDEIPYGIAGYNSLFKIQPTLDDHQEDLMIDCIFNME